MDRIDHALLGRLKLRADLARIVAEHHDLVANDTAPDGNDRLDAMVLAELGLDPETNRRTD